MPEQNHIIRRVPAGRGVAWLTGALLLIRRQPARLLLIGLILQFLMGFSQVGVLGLVFILAIPSFTAGMMQAMQVTDHGSRPPLSILFSAFTSSDRMMRLILLGALMLAGGVIALMLVLSGSVAGLDPAIMARLEAGDITALDTIDPSVIQRLMFALLAGLLVSGGISYFAIPLVWFRNSSLGAAIKLGVLGMIRNWRPFLVLGLLLAVLAMPAAIMMGIMLAVSASGSATSPVYTVLMLLVAVAYQLVLFGVQYFSFKEIFGAGRPAGMVETDESQLVA